MTTLTLDAIKANPWNAVWLDLPADADAALLTAALAAADTCMREAHGKMMDVRDGLLIPEGYLEEPYPKPDAHEGFENDWWNALERTEEIRTRLGLPLVLLSD